MRIKGWKEFNRCLRAGSIVVDHQGIISYDPFVMVAYFLGGKYCCRITAERIVVPMIEISAGLRMEVSIEGNRLTCVVRDERCSGRGAVDFPPEANWDGFFSCLRRAAREGMSFYAVVSGRASLCRR